MAQKLIVEIAGDTSKLESSFRSASTAAEDSGSRISKAGSKMSETFKGAFTTFGPLAAGLGAAEFAKGAIEGAEKLEKANKSLEIALSHTKGASDDQLAAFQKTAKSASDFGVSQTDATAGLSRALLVTHNAAAAQRAYQEALVISKATGKDFGAVLLATGKAQDGITGGLSRYGVVMKKGSDGQQQFNQVMSAYKGQAEANTSASDKLRANFDNLQATVGTKLLPAFDAIVEGLNKVIAWFESPQVAAAVQSFVNTVTTAAQPVIDWFQQNWPEIKQVIVTTLQDVEAVVKGILGGLEAFWRSWGGTITTIVKNTFNGIKQEIQGIVKVIEGVIKIVDGLIHGRWGEVWAGMKQVVVGAFQWLTAYPLTLLRNLGAVFSKLGGGIMSALGNALRAGAHLVGSAIDFAIVDPINAVIGFLDGIHIHIPKIHIPLVGDFGGGDITPFNIPQIPALAIGTNQVFSDGLAFLHRGEQVVPANVAGGGFNGRSGITVNVYGWVGTDQDLAQRLRNQLVRQGLYEPSILGGRA